MIGSEDDSENRESNPYASFGNERGEIVSGRSRPRGVFAPLLISAGWGAATFVAMYLAYLGVYMAIGAPWTEETPWMAGVAASAVGIATAQAGVLRAASSGAIRWIRCWIVSGVSVPVAAFAGAFLSRSLAPPRVRYEPPDPAVWNIFVVGTLSAQLLLGSVLVFAFWLYVRNRMPAKPKSALQ